MWVIIFVSIAFVLLVDTAYDQNDLILQKKIKVINRFRGTFPAKMLTFIFSAIPFGSHGDFTIRVKHSLADVKQYLSISIFIYIPVRTRNRNHLMNSYQCLFDLEIQCDRNCIIKRIKIYPGGMETPSFSNEYCNKSFD